MDQENLFNNEEERNLFAVVGLYIVSYQQTEDFLFNIFSRACGENNGRIAGIFYAINGLENKCKIISMIIESDDQKNEWSSLYNRLSAAQKTRNDVAHGNNAVEFDEFYVTHNDGNMEVFIKGDITQKVIKNNFLKITQNSYSVDDIIEKFQELRKLDKELRLFCWKLGGLDPSQFYHPDGPIIPTLVRRPFSPQSNTND